MTKEKYQVQVGPVKYSITSPVPYSWRKNDLEFFADTNVNGDVVTADIEFVDQFPQIEGQTVYENESTIFKLTEDGEEIRYYRGLYSLEDPAHAMSVYDGESIKMYYLTESDRWRDSKMQLWNMIHMENKLLEKDAFVLHSSYIHYEGGAILFTAPSGTGKTTQANLWKKIYNAEIINGDLCLLWKKDGQWEGCGFPHHGSAQECENRNYPLKAVVIVRQSKENRIEEIGPAQAAALILSEATVNIWNQQQVNKALDLMVDLTLRVPVIILHCNMDDEAALKLHDYLY